MAEAIFQLSAEITPEVNPAALQRQAADISQKINAALDKQIKPVQLSFSDKVVSQVQATAKRIGDGFQNAIKNNETFNRVLAGTQTLIEKTVRGVRTVGFEAQTIFSRLTQNLGEFAQKGLATISAELQKIAPKAAAAFNQIRISASTAFEQAKIGVSKFTDFLNVTNTKLIIYQGSLIQAIRDNSRFKASFDDLSRSAGFLNTLPTSFKTLQAQVLSGTSALQKQAAAGDSLSAKLTPFLLLGVAIARTVDRISQVIIKLGADISALVSKTVPAADRLRTAIEDIGPAGKKVGDALNNIGNIAPEVASKLQRAVIEARGQGVEPLNKAILQSRDEVLKLANVGNVFTRLFDPSKGERLTEARDKIKEINKEIFKIEEIRGEVPFFQRLAIRSEEARQKVQAAGTATANVIKEVAGDARELALAIPDAQRLFDPGVVAAGKRTEQAVEGVSGKLAQLREFAKGVLGSTFGVEFSSQAAKAAQGVQQSLFTPLETAAINAGQKAGNNFSQGFSATAKADAEEAGGDLADSVSDSFGKRFKASKGTQTGIKGFAAGLRGAFADERGAISLGNLAGGLGKVGEAAAGAGGKLAGLTRVFGQVAGGTGILSGGLAAVAGRAGLAGLAIAAVNAAAEMETLKVALNGVFGSEAEAGFEKIAEFAAKTPFTVQTATNSVIKLGSALKGLTIEGGLAITEQIAGAAAAIGASDDAINRVTLAFTQIAAVGKLTADNIRQITEALPNVSQGAIFENLAEGLGVSTAQAKKFSQEGLVPSEEGLKAIIKSLNEVPGAAGALEKQSQTFSGLLSTLKDNSTQLLAALGTPLLAVLKPVLSIVSRFLGLLTTGLKVIIEDAKNLPDNIRKIGERFKVVGDILETLGDAFRKVSEKAREFIDFLKDLPLLGSALNAISGAFGGVGGAAEDAGNKMEASLQKALDAAGPVSRALAAVRNATDPKAILENFELLQDAQTEQAEQANKSAAEQVEKVLALKSVFEARTNAAKGVTAAEKALTDAIKQHDDQIAKETLKLEKDLADARDKTAESTDKQAEAQAKLDELLKGASAEELEKGDLALASAKLRLRQLIEDERKAQEALNNTQKVSIDLSGLSLDQIKSRLSTVRASIAAAKAEKKVASEISEEQKAINEAGKQIERRSAELDILDAEKAIAELRQKGTELDPAIIAAREAVRDAQKEVEASKQRELDIDLEIQKLHGPDLEFEKEKASLQASITEAKKNQAQAESDAQLAIARAKGDSGEILRILEDRIRKEPELLQVLKDSNIPIKDAQKLSADLGIVFRQQVKSEVVDTRTEVEKVNDALRETIRLSKQFGIDSTRSQLELAKQLLIQGKTAKDLDQNVVKFVNEVSANDKKIANAVNEVAFAFLKESGIKDPESVSKELKDQFINVGLVAAVQAIQAGNTNIESVKKEIEKALRQIPGFNQVELARGAVVHGPTQALIGEAGKEAVLPLTNASRMIKLLSNKHVLPPVLTALEKITLPGAKAPVMEDFKLSPTSPVTHPKMVRSVAQNKNAQEQNKRDKALAKAIVSEMKEAGLGGGGGTTVNNSFVQPESTDPLNGIKIRQIAREVKKQIEKDW